MNTYHLPIMCQEVVNLLSPAPRGLYVDCTLGGGGHSLEILKAASPDGQLIGLDQDMEAIKKSEEVLADYRSRATLVHSNFKQIQDILEERGIVGVNGILADLGVSSHQLNSAERGFSFRYEGPLDMRMNRNSGEMAWQLMVRLSIEELTFIIKKYGEERWAKPIAAAIKERGDIKGTRELAELIERVIPRKFHPKKIHAATRTFQALRIVVNEELTGLDEFIVTSSKLLKKGGRIAVISFHSLEDRIIKHSFKALSKGCICPADLPYCRCDNKETLKIITKKSITPSEKEIEKNPRARSARLRVAERV